MNPAAVPASPLLALLDDAGAGAGLLEISSALARALQRELSLVYVESERALVAAALPCTQVLGPAGICWRPLQPRDIEQGFRVQAARLREMAARIALRDTLNWSLRVVRGSLIGAAAELGGESDLLLLAGGAPALPVPRGGIARLPTRRPCFTVLGAAGDGRALQVAQQLAQALAGVVETAPLDPGGGLAFPPGVRQALLRSDVLVLSRGRLDAPTLALLHVPVLLVG